MESPHVRSSCHAVHRTQAQDRRPILEYAGTNVSIHHVVDAHRDDVNAPKDMLVVKCSQPGSRARAENTE